MEKDYEKCVFINCPFDDEFMPLLRALIFTIVSLDFKPRISLEESDAGTARLAKIMNLIKNSRFSIHDLSRIKSSSPEEFFRLNMPFELGLDFGCRNYSVEKKHINKKYLILGEKRYEYMKGLSDISGIDIKYHKNEIYDLIKVVRHWFVDNTGISKVRSPREIYNYFIDYNTKFYKHMVEEKGYEENEIFDIPLKEQLEFIENFYNNDSIK